MELYSEEALKNLTSTDSIKRLQKELEKIKVKQTKLKEEKLYRTKSKKDVKRVSRETFDATLESTLDELYKIFNKEITKGAISMPDEFSNMVRIGFVLYTRLMESSKRNDEDNIKNDATELEIFLKELETYQELKKKEVEKFSDIKKEYLSEGELLLFESEKTQLENDIEKIEAKIRRFTKIFFAEIFKDFKDFKDFLEEDSDKILDKRAKTLQTLAELSELYKIFDNITEREDIYEENSQRTLEKLNMYMGEIDGFKLAENYENYTTLKQDLAQIIESISENGFETKGDIVYILLHFVWANILITNNIMKFPVIDEEYSKGVSHILSEVHAARNMLLENYKDDLRYYSGISVPAVENIEKDDDGSETQLKKTGTSKLNRYEVEKMKDFLFYDVLLLNTYKEKYKEELEAFRKNETEEVTEEGYIKKSFEMKVKVPEFAHFQNLTSDINSVPNTMLFPKKEGARISYLKGIDKFALVLGHDEFVQVINALEAIEVLKKNGGYRNVLSFINNENFRTQRLSLKKPFDNETDLKYKVILRVYESFLAQAERFGKKLSSEIKFEIFNMLEIFNSIERYEFLEMIIFKKEIFDFLIEGIMSKEPYDAYDYVENFYKLYLILERKLNEIFRIDYEFSELVSEAENNRFENFYESEEFKSLDSQEASILKSELVNFGKLLRVEDVSKENKEENLDEELFSERS